MEFIHAQSSSCSREGGDGVYACAVVSRWSSVVPCMGIVFGDFVHGYHVCDDDPYIGSPF